VDVTPRRDSQAVNPLTTFVRSLGNAGALANVQTVLDARAQEDWLVQGLTRRLERTDASGAVGTAVDSAAARAVA
jgi:hypothetical protein